jgi:hypothetical protein
MKRIINTAGLVVLGAASLQAVYGQGTVSSGDPAKPWSVSLDVRGFYDSNYLLDPSGEARHTWGTQVSPSVSLNLPLDQTFIGAGFVYILRYYANNPQGSPDADHTYQGNVHLEHTFNENYSVKVADTAVYAEDPTIIEQGTTQTHFNPQDLREEQTGFHNTGHAELDARFTPLIGANFSYNNNFYNYQSAVYGPLLDRIEHLASADLRFQVQPDTVALLGYQFGYNDFTSSDALAPGVAADSRNSESHYIYLGVDQTFSPHFTASARVGAEYTDYVNDSFAAGAWNPYGDGNLTWRYKEGSSVTLGVRHSRNVTDQAVASSGFNSAVTLQSLILDQETTMVYANLTHQFTGKITGTLFGQYQNSAFSGTGNGSYNNDVDDYFILGANASYKINQYFTAQAGYNFDKLNSEVQGRGFTRHLVYLGVRATY